MAFALRARVSGGLAPLPSVRTCFGAVVTGGAPCLGLHLGCACTRTPASVFFFEWPRGALGPHTVFAGFATVKKYWRKQDNGWIQFASDIDPGLGRQYREALYQEDHGVACASRAQVVVETSHRL